MSHLSISAQFFSSHLLELKSSYYTKKGLLESKSSPFGLLSEWEEPNIMPISLENKYYPDRNIWVVCIIPLNRRFRWKETIDSGFSLEDAVSFFDKNKEKPVYLYVKSTFFPVYRTDIVEWNGLFGIFESFPNHLKEPMDDKPLDGIDSLIKQARYCVSIDEYVTTNGLGEAADMDRPIKMFYFSNLISAKLFYNKKVAHFMECVIPEEGTNFDKFSQTSLSWHGLRWYRSKEWGHPEWREEHLLITIRTVKISYDRIEGEYDLI